MKEIRNHRWLVLFFLLLLIIVAPYGKVEYLTSRYGDKFADLYTATGMIDNIEYFKIMEYSEAKAKVYYVVEHKATGILVTFSKRATEWICDTWEAVWSTAGSADGFIWPYYR